MLCKREMHTITLEYLAHQTAAFHAEAMAALFFALPTIQHSPERGSTARNALASQFSYLLNHDQCWWSFPLDSSSKIYLFIYLRFFVCLFVFCNNYGFVVSVRSLDKPEGVKAKLGLCSCPWWNVIIGICRNLHWKDLALTGPLGYFCPGKITDWHLVSPWCDFTQLTGIKRNAGAQRSRAVWPALARIPVCPAALGELSRNSSASDWDILSLRIYITLWNVWVTANIISIMTNFWIEVEMIIFLLAVGVRIFLCLLV